MLTFLNGHFHVTHRTSQLPNAIAAYRAIAFFFCVFSGVWTVMTFADYFPRAMKRMAH